MAQLQHNSSHHVVDISIPGDTTSLQVHQLQFLFMGLIFVIATSAGLAPVLLQQYFGRRWASADDGSRVARLLSCASCFGAGVFLFVCFLGLLPAADSKFHKILANLQAQAGEEWGPFAHFPWGFFVVTCGFLIIFTIDKLVHAFETERSKSPGPKHGAFNTVTLLSVVKDAPVASIPKPPCPAASDDLPGGLESKYDATANLEMEKDIGVVERGQGVPSSLIFLLALTSHSVFEGVAIGLQKEWEKVLEFGVAVLVHEVVMALSFGLEVSRSCRLARWMQVVYVVVFTASIPLGIAVGFGLQNTPSASRDIVSAVCEAFATGIFLHVIFIEILAKEFPEHHHHHHHSHHRDDNRNDLAHQPHHTIHHHNRYDKSSIKLVRDENCSSINPLSSVPVRGGPSEVCLILEKILSICAGILLLVLLKVFMHSEH